LRARHPEKDGIENLTTGLSRKIWQNIMILGRYAPKKEPSSTGGKKAKTVRVKSA
jgi:hypothetical protein